jgi:hypothetical protein
MNTIEQILREALSAAITPAGAVLILVGMIIGLVI